MSLLSSLLLTFVLASLGLAECDAISAPRFLGRVNPATNELTWPATGIAFSFTGTSATINFAATSGTNSLDLIIDNASPIAITNFSTTSLTIPTLHHGHHSVQLTHRSETLFGTLTFSNVTVNGTLKPSPPSPRRIEFIGDSITVGYGAAGTLPCTVSAANEDAYTTYGARTARNLSAEHSLVAWSGIGLVRNYESDGDTGPVMPERWTRWGADDADDSYVFPTSVDREPQAVVINLGTNDYSYRGDDGSEVRPPLNDTEFAEGYLDFVGTVRGRYPRASFFLCSSPMLIDGYPTADDAQHSSQLRAIERVVGWLNDTRVRAVDFPSQQIGVGLTGCDEHPGPVGHQAMADILIPAIKDALKW